MVTRRQSWATLTAREVEVLKLIASGFSTQQIATALNITFKTAACHRYHIMDKLGIHEIANLTRYALRNGYLSLSEDATPSPSQDELFDRIRVTYGEYRRASDDYAAFLQERHTLGRENPDGVVGLRTLREKEKAAHQNYHAALVAFREFLLPPR